MNKIAAKAAALDKVLAGLDERLEKVDDRQSDFSANFASRTKRMNESAVADIMGIRTNLTSLSQDLTSISRKRTLVIDADTSRAERRIRSLQERISKNTSMGVTGGGILGAAGGGGIAGLASRAAQRRGASFGGALAMTAEGLDQLAKSMGGVRISLGFMSARLAALPGVLALIGPPVMATLAAGLSILSGALASVGAAAVGAASMLGAFTFGIAAIGIPMAMAGKRISEANEELVKAKEAVEKAKPGTVTYARAVKRLEEANKALSKTDRELIKNSGALKDAWNKQIMAGRSGRRAVMVMNEAVLFGTSNMPVLARMMDDFTLSGVRMFRSMNANAPRFQRTLLKSTDEWPARFEEMGQSIGHLSMGLLGVVRAAEPFTKWMSQGLLENMEQFSVWANGGGGQMKMRQFFNDMKPILNEVGDIIWDIGAGIVEIAQRDKGDIVYFLQEIEDIIEKLPGFVDKWTDRFRGAWPAIEATGSDMLSFFDHIANALSDIKKFAGPVASGIRNVVLEMSKPIPEGMKDWAAILGTLGIFMGGKNLIGRARGRRGGGGGGKGGGLLGGGLAGAASDMAPIPVWVMNPGFGGKVPPVVPTGVPGGRTAGRVGRVGSLAGRVLRNPFVRGGGIAAVGLWGAERGITLRRERLEREREAYARAFGPGGGSTGGGTTYATGPTAPARMNPLTREIETPPAPKRNTFTPSQAQKVVQGWDMNGVQMEILRMLTDTMDANEIQSVMRSRTGAQMVAGIQDAVGRAGDTGVYEMRIAGMDMVLAYNAEMDKIETRRIDLSGFFADMWAKFRAGVGALGGIVQSVTGPLDNFWNTLTGGGGTPGPGAAPAKSAGLGSIGGVPLQGPPAPAGDSKKGAGIKARVAGALSGAGNLLGGIANGAGDIVSKVVGWLQSKGSAGVTTGNGIGVMQDAMNAHMASQYSSGGAVSADGLLPAAQNLANMLSSMFGVTLTSGFRPGAVTESGNMSLHGMGRAIDVGGTAGQMQAVWNYLQGKGGIDEMIYAGQIAENGGPPRPYGGADKHYDHVHIGIGDSSRGSGVPAAQAAVAAGKSVTISFAGAVFHIKTEADYEAFMARFADDIERAANSTGTVSAGGMLDAG